MANITPSAANDRIFAEKAARSPKCARCRNHGFVVQLKGHSGKCQFKQCLCWKCILIKERTRILAYQRRIKSGNGNKSPVADQSEPSALSGRKTLSVGKNTSTNGEHGRNDANARERVSKAPVARDDTSDEMYLDLQAPPATCAPVTLSAVNGDLKTPAGPIAPIGALGDSSPFAGKYAIKEAFPGQMYPAEMLAMPFSLYPDKYAIPAVLVSLRPPAPGFFREHVGLVPLQAGAPSHPLESREWQIHVPHYTPFPPYDYSHLSQSHMDGQQISEVPPQAASVAEHLGNQEREDVPNERLSSGNTA